jgi:arginyl-tRNA synthetase
MAHFEVLSSEGLTTKLAGIDLFEAALFHEVAFPALGPVDILHCVISDDLSKISRVDRKLIYPALSWINSLDKGDLLLAVP